MTPATARTALDRLGASVLISRYAEATLVADADGHIVMANETLTQMFGYTADEMQTLRIEDLLPERYRARHTTDRTRYADRPRARAMGSGIELVAQRRDGREFPVDVNLSPFPTGEGLLTLAVVHDVTRRKDSLARLKLLTDAIPGLVGYVDRELVYRFCNAGYRVWLGPAADTCVGRTLAEVWGPALYQTLRPHAEAALAGHPAEFDLTADLPGGLREARARFLPHRDAEGRVVGFYTLTLDVTRERRAERELADRRSENAYLMRLNTAGELAAALAHELGQPLAAIAAYSEAALLLLRGGGSAPEKILHSLEQSALQARRAGQVLRELRGFLRREAPETGLVDINDLIRDSLDLLDSEARRSNVKIVANFADGLPLALVNRVQVEQVLINLMQNGIESIRQAGLPEGRLTIQSRHEDAPGHAPGQAGALRISVADTGPGLDPENAARIFQRFYTTKPKGLGMGLAISRGLIEAQGGKLWAEEKPGPGALFHFTLPTAQAPDPDAQGS